jgi:preprotein translocase subunit SecD
MRFRGFAIIIPTLIVALVCVTVAGDTQAKPKNDSALRELANGKRRADSIFSVREVHGDAEQLAKRAATEKIPAPQGYEFLMSKDIFSWGKNPIWIAVSQHAALDASDVESAVATFENGEHGIAVTLSKEGRERFTEFTTRCVDRRIALVAEGKIVLSAPVVRAPIPAGRIYLPYGLNEESSKALATKLNSKK